MKTGARLSESTWFLLTAIVGAAAVVRFWGLGFGLPHTQARPDESFIIDTARSFLRGNFYPPFYDYPWLSMWVAAVLYLGYFVWGAVTGAFHSVADMLASWPVHWEPFFLIDRAASATLGTATTLVVFWIGWKLRDVATGLVAAFLLSFAFIHARDSHFGTTDIAMTFLIVVAVGLLMEAHRTRQRSTFALAGLASGLAAATKYNAVVLVVTIVTSQILHLAESRESRGRAFDGRLLAFSVPFALAFAVGVPFVVLDSTRFLAAMRELVRSMRVGSPNLDQSSGWVHHLELSLRYGLGLPLLGAGLVGMVGIFRREPKIGALLFSFPIAYYAVAGSIRNLFFRYTIPVVPFLCLAAAWIVCEAALALTRRVSPESQRRFVLPAATILLAGVIVWPSARSIVQFDRIVSQTDNRVVVARWLVENVPRGSSIAQSGTRYGLVQFDPRVPYTSWVWDGAREIFLVNGRPANGRPDWILVQESPLPSRTQGLVKQYLAKDGYTFVTNFPAVELTPDLVYDQQDYFFVPFSGLEHVTRPGPNFTLFKRTAPLKSNGP